MKNEINQGVIHVSINQRHAGQRLDNFLIGQLKGVPKSRIYRMIRRSEVRVNKKRVKADHKLALGDDVRIPPIRVGIVEHQQASPRLLALLSESILFEDDSFVIMNKPTGLAVHSGTAEPIGMIEALRQLKSIFAELELVHRIDKETSGCIIFAKTRAALTRFHEMMRQGNISKRYRLLTVGTWPEKLTQCCRPLKKQQLIAGERMVTVADDGRPAQTLFTVMRRYSDATLLEAQLITGRMHQIRVHTAYLGYPIVGDRKYGNKKINQVFRQQGLARMFLHAYQLSFEHPETGEAFSIQAPLDKSLQAFLDHLETNTI